MTNKTANEILALLEQERLALRRGAFDPLESFELAKMDLFAHLQSTKVSGSHLTAIKNALAKNQVLLAAAIDGVKAARARLKALENVRENLAVYDNSGEMSHVPLGKMALRKKA